MRAKEKEGVIKWGKKEWRESKKQKPRDLGDYYYQGGEMPQVGWVLEKCDKL